MRRLLAFAAKAAISGLLLYLALRLVNFSALQQHFSQLDVTWIIAALVTLIAQVALVSVRWQCIANHCGAPLSTRDALRYTLIGAFFNQTLPSTVGGDAARMWLLARSAGSWKASVYSVLIDRAAGLIWLAMLVLVCLQWSLRLIESPVGRITLVLIGIGGVAGPLVLFAITHAARSLFARWRATRHLLEIAAIMWKVLVSARTGSAVAALSVAVHLMTVLVAWFAAKAIDSPLTLTYSLLLVPPVILIAAVPVSIAGWGVREGAMVAAFTYAGLSDSDGLAISLLFGIGMFTIGAVGGLIWILSGERGRLKPEWSGTVPPGTMPRHTE